MPTMAPLFVPFRECANPSLLTPLEGTFVPSRSCDPELPETDPCHPISMVPVFLFDPFAKL